MKLYIFPKLSLHASRCVITSLYDKNYVWFCEKLLKSLSKCPDNFVFLLSLNKNCNCSLWSHCICACGVYVCRCVAAFMCTRVCVCHLYGVCMFVLMWAYVQFYTYMCITYVYGDKGLMLPVFLVPSTLPVYRK